MQIYIIIIQEDQKPLQKYQNPYSSLQKHLPNV